MRGGVSTARVPEEAESVRDGRDYGEPVGSCKETAANSGVFEREWAKASIKMDCNTWTPTITLK